MDFLLNTPYPDSITSLTIFITSEYCLNLSSLNLIFAWKIVKLKLSTLICLKGSARTLHLIKDNILNENNNIDNNNSVQKSGKSLKKNEKTNIIKQDECEIKIESKKESCCLTCSHFTNNPCYLW